MFYGLLNAGPVKKRKIKKLFKHSAVVNDHFTGFALYDMDRQKMVFELNDDKYYTPASNTKLFTLYACLKTLGDSIPAIRYVTRGDSLIFWATGDPSFLHKELAGVSLFDFLKASGKQLYFSSGIYSGSFFGHGWAWDDYNDDFQAEINELPIANNMAVITGDKNGKLLINPACLSPLLKCDSDYTPGSFKVKRGFADNTFTYPAMPPPPGFRQGVPLKTSTQLTLELLTDTLKKPVYEVHIPLADDAKTIYSVNADTVYRHMLQPSDDFLAEQLMLVCSSVRFKTLNTDSVINYMKAHFLNDMPDTVRWVDGSGLSRYNLFTPRSIITLLLKIRGEVKNDELLYSMLPAGGVSGTIKSAYKTDSGKPFVWAKTGTMSNNHNLSGYLVTKKGTHLAFSFMNSNYTRPTHDIRDEMARIITYIHDHN